MLPADTDADRGIGDRDMTTIAEGDAPMTAPIVVKPDSDADAPASPATGSCQPLGTCSYYVASVAAWPLVYTPI